LLPASDPERVLPERRRGALGGSACRLGGLGPGFQSAGWVLLLSGDSGEIPGSCRRCPGPHVLQEVRQSAVSTQAFAGKIAV